MSLLFEKTENLYKCSCLQDILMKKKCYNRFVEPVLFVLYEGGYKFV